MDFVPSPSVAAAGRSCPHAPPAFHSPSPPPPLAPTARSTRAAANIRTSAGGLELEGRREQLTGELLQRTGELLPLTGEQLSESGLIMNCTIGLNECAVKDFMCFWSEGASLIRR